MTFILSLFLSFVLPSLQEGTGAGGFPGAWHPGSAPGRFGPVGAACRAGSAPGHTGPARAESPPPPPPPTPPQPPKPPKEKPVPKPEEVTWSQIKTRHP